jgi:DNA-binding transcriptional ArsR family regulator
MYNSIVMYRSETVGGALVALADPTRRGMVELLAERPRRAGELVAAFPVSQPAISRHLRILRHHGLIDEQRADGDRRGRVYRLRAESLDPLASWLDEVRRFWAGHLEDFRSFVEQERGGLGLPQDPASAGEVH